MPEKKYNGYVYTSRNANKQKKNLKKEGIRPMKRRISIVLSLALALTLGAGYFGSFFIPLQSVTSAFAAPAEREPLNYVYIGASTTGAAYLYAATFADIVTRYVPYMSITVEAIGGTEEHLRMINAGMAEFGGGSDSLNYQAHHGIGWAENEQFENLRLFSVRDIGALHFVTMPHRNDINSIADANGLRLGWGPAGGSTVSMGNDLIEALGIEPGPIQYATWTDCFNALRDGQLDMVWGNGAYPMPQVMEFEAGGECKYITLTKEELEIITTRFPWYSSGEFPAARYRYANAETWDALLSIYVTTTSAVIPQDIIYDINKALWENKDEMIATVAGFANNSPEGVLKLGLPIHAGTVQYLKEIGIDVPAELIPPEYIEVSR